VQSYRAVGSTNGDENFISRVHYAGCGGDGSIIPDGVASSAKYQHVGNDHSSYTLVMHKTVGANRNIIAAAPRMMIVRRR